MVLFYFIIFVPVFCYDVFVGLGSGCKTAFVAEPRPLPNYFAGNKDQ
jgi:hypothetical protein